MFRVEVIGNLGADAEVKNSQGSKFITMRIAHSSKYKAQDGSERELTEWIDATINDAESKVLPYLKKGVKVFVRGNASLRVYSSPKDRIMKAGIQISVREIELIGGQTETIPKHLIDPATAQIYNTEKFYWINRDNKSLKKGELYTMVDERGNQYLMNKHGFIAPPQDGNQDNNDNSNSETETADKK